MNTVASGAKRSFLVKGLGPAPLWRLDVHEEGPGEAREACAALRPRVSARPPHVAGGPWPVPPRGPVLLSLPFLEVALPLSRHRQEGSP